MRALHGPVSPQVSVIATVYNEGNSLQRLLDSLLAQRCQPDEIVICDGGSTDDTVSILESYQDRLPNLRILIEPGANISQGRNRAVAAARGPVIAATDAGVRLDPDWLHNLVAPFTAGEHVPLAAAGFFLPDVRGTFETAMAATVLPLREDIDPATFLPSSRSVAFTRQAWQQAGGYPEWLDYCEDLVFDCKLNEQQPDRTTAFAWAPGAIAYFRPRSSLWAFAVQYFRYARGDGKADLWRGRHAVRYATYGLLLPALLGHALRGRFARWLGWLGLIAGLLAYCARPWQRLQRLDRSLSGPRVFRARLLAAALVPLIRLIGDCAKMAGYPAGLWWRWQNHRRSELDWR